MEEWRRAANRRSNGGANEVSAKTALIGGTSIPCDPSCSGCCLPSRFPENRRAKLRVFGLGYLDDRDNVLKTDNRAAAVRSADLDHIRIGTYGGNYLRTIPTAAGTFDGLF